MARLSELKRIEVIEAPLVQAEAAECCEPDCGPGTCISPQGPTAELTATQRPTANANSCCDGGCTCS